MTFSTYYLYVAAIAQRDLAILTIAIVVFVCCEIVLVIHLVRPGATKVAAWIFIGGFYATLLAMALYLRAGA